MKLLARVMPNSVVLTPPPAEPAVSAWKQMLEADAATLRERANRAVLAKTLTKCAVCTSNAISLCACASGFLLHEARCCTHLPHNKHD